MDEKKYIGKLALITRKLYFGEQFEKNISAGEVVLILNVLDINSIILEKRVKILYNQKILTTPIENIMIYNPTTSLKGKSFCFTGESKSKTREFFKAFVKIHGGEFHSIARAKLDYLVVCNSFSLSSKIEKVKKYNSKTTGKKYPHKEIEIITEEEFLKLTEEEHKL